MWGLATLVGINNAANDYFFEHDSFGICYRPYPEKSPGAIVMFAAVEVEGEGTFIARCFRNMIIRRGGVKPPWRPFTLQEISKIIGWTRAPEELLEEGWIGEETFEQAREREQREQ